MAETLVFRIGASEGRKAEDDERTSFCRPEVALLGNGTAAGGPYRLYAIGGSALENPTNQTGALASVEVFVV